MTDKLALTGSGRFIVSVNGVDLDGEHNFEREAIQRAANLELANPADVVEYRNELRVTVVAKAATPIPVPPPVIVPGADVLWSCDFTRPLSEYGFGIHARESGGGGRVTFETLNGERWVRLKTLPGDNNVNGSNLAERCDLRLGDVQSDAQEGREWWFAHSVIFPDDYVDLPQSNETEPGGLWHWGAAMDWHDDGDTPGSQGPSQLMAMPRTANDPGRPTGLTYQIYGGAYGSAILNQFAIEPIVRNKRLDFVYHTKWTSTPAGFTDAWLNGKSIFKHRGPTLYTGRGAYLKLANYHTAHGKASSILHARIIRGRTAAAVARTPLEGV